MKTWRLLVSIILFLVFLAGCSPAAPSPTPAPTLTPTKPAPSLTPTQTTKPAPVSIQPKLGGTLNFPITLWPAGMDPHRKLSWLPFISVPIFSQLVRFNPNTAGTEIGDIVPDLAQKWEVTPDGKTWTFYLYKNVKWHDGAAFTADDVVYSIDKMRDPKRSAVTGFFKQVNKVEKVDDYTVKVYLTNPSPSFFIELASAYCPIESRKTANIDFNSTDFLIGTGPFKVKKIVSGVNIELVKNPDYFRKDANGVQLPYLDGLNIFVIADANAQVDAIVTKRLDMGIPGFSLSDQDLIDGLRSKAKDVVIQRFPAPYGTVQFYNTKATPLNDARVRKALSILKDRREDMVALRGNESADAWLNIEHAFFSGAYGLSRQEIDKIAGWDKPYEQRVTEAKKLMADAGYANGFKLKAPVTSTALSQRSAQFAADKYRKYLNIDYEIIPLAQAEFNKARQSGNFGVIGFLSQALFGDPDELKDFFYGSSPANISGYSNPDLDKLWDQQSNTMDPAKRKQITQEIERKLLTDWPAFPGSFQIWYTCWWPHVKGYVVQGTTYTSNTSFEVVWLNR